MARAHLRELMRRRLAIFMLLALPLLFYKAAFNDALAISFAAVGLGWSVAIISLFSTHAMDAITPRLVLAGFRASDIVVGRLLSLAAFGITVGTALFIYLRRDPVVVTDSQLLLALIFAVVGAMAAGLAVGTLLRREMEAMLILIALVALTLVIDWTSWPAKVLPMYATDRYAWASVDGVLASDPNPWAEAFGVSVALALVAVVGTIRRTPKVER